jgi:virginiamycin B lyase
VWRRRRAGGRTDPDGTVSSVPVLTPDGSPYGLCAGPGRTLWYTLLAADRIGRISLDGRIEEFPLPAGSMPSLITAGPDGGCWATLWAASSVVRLDRDGCLAEQISFQPGSEPHGIALGPDGSVWVALEAGSLAHLTP